MLITLKRWKLIICCYIDCYVHRMTKYVNRILSDWWENFLPHPVEISWMSLQTSSAPVFAHATAVRPTVVVALPWTCSSLCCWGLHRRTSADQTCHSEGRHRSLALAGPSSKRLDRTDPTRVDLKAADEAFETHWARCSTLECRAPVASVAGQQSCLLSPRLQLTPQTTNAMLHSLTICQRSDYDRRHCHALLNAQSVKLE